MITFELSLTNTLFILYKKVRLGSKVTRLNFMALGPGLWNKQTCMSKPLIIQASWLKLRIVFHWKRAWSLNWTILNSFVYKYTLQDHWERVNIKSERYVNFVHACTVFVYSHNYVYFLKLKWSYNFLKDSIVSKLGFRLIIKLSHIFNSRIIKFT